jgi:long-chain acyl-CoA synthetase
VSFVESIFEKLQQRGDAVVLREVHDGQFVAATGREFLQLVGQARHFVTGLGLQKGDRCALLAPNSIRWMALDLALMSEGLIVVPLYARQSPRELAAMIRDASPAVIFASDENLVAEIGKDLPVCPVFASLDRAFASENSLPPSEEFTADSDPVTIIYTSGTSGEAKGVVLTAANVNHMLQCTNARLDLLMAGGHEPDKVFHYTPFCFAASWIAMLTFLSRESVVTLSTDLTKLAEELKLASPDYFLNVPTLLERVRTKITETIHKRTGILPAVFDRAQRCFFNEGRGPWTQRACLSFARRVMFPEIRKSIGPNLKALICGSAPLALETQRFYMMLGIPVLQVYGLTETTAICTMDDPRDFEPGKVGMAIPGIEMRVAENGEILVRGPNIFSAYWQRPQETAKALEGGWFHTGDQGEVDAKGKWQVTGRLKNLVVLNSGHKFAPEPLEQALATRLPVAQQIVVLGNQRSYPAALIATSSTNGPLNESVQAALVEINANLPHYKQIRCFQVIHEPFSIENGLLTANGKIKREAVSSRYAAEIDRLYQRQPS